MAVREAIFPSAFRSTVPPGTESTRYPVALVASGYIVAFVAAFGLDVWWAGTHAMSRIWAEDGAVFLAGAHSMHFGQAFFRPYAGYMHAVPRSLAELTTLFPLRDAAAILAAAAAAVRAVVALFVFRASSGHLRSPWVRGMLAASVALLPAGGLETLDNIANLHWYLTFAVFWALLWRPQRRWECALAGFVVLVGVGSSPMPLLLFPLVVLRVVSLASVRRLRDYVVPACFVVAGVAQGIAVLRSARPPHETFGPAVVSRAYGVRIGAGALAGYQHADRIWLDLHYLGVAIAAVVLLALIVPAIRLPGPRRWLAIIGLGASAAMFALMFAQPAVRPHTPIDIIRSLPRYDVLPSLLVLCAVAAGLDALARWPGVAVRIGVALVFSRRRRPACPAPPHDGAGWNPRCRMARSDRVGAAQLRGTGRRHRSRGATPAGLGHDAALFGADAVSAWWGAAQGPLPDTMAGPSRASVHNPRTGQNGQPMRVLVTGAAGFIGSHYVRTMLSGGYPAFAEAEVTVFDKLTYAGNLRQPRSRRRRPPLPVRPGRHL